MSFSMSIRAEGAQEAQSKYNAAADAVGVRTGGLRDILLVGLLQMERFVLGNIEVDTGRTKNSIFQDLAATGNSIRAMLGTNVIYSPYVRDAGHKEQFFEYAAKVEGPRVAERMGGEVVIRVERAFD